MRKSSRRELLLDICKTFNSDLNRNMEMLEAASTMRATKDFYHFFQHTISWIDSLNLHIPNRLYAILA